MAGGMYTGNAMKTNIGSSPPASLTPNFRSSNDINGSFERQAVMCGMVRGRITMPFTVYRLPECIRGHSLLLVVGFLEVA